RVETSCRPPDGASMAGKTGSLGKLKSTAKYCQATVDRPRAPVLRCRDSAGRGRASRRIGKMGRGSGPSAIRQEANMASQKLVRCHIRAKGSRGEGSARFIPLEIFGLWEYLMTHKHDFEVVSPRASLWLDMEDSPETAYSDQQFERVTEVTAFVYSNRDEMFTRACRYFRSDECPDLRP